jgi:hypothetical protein
VRRQPACDSAAQAVTAMVSAAASAVSAPPSRVACGARVLINIEVDPGEPDHPLGAEPLDVGGVADGVDPAQHRGQRPLQLGGDPPVSGPEESLGSVEDDPESNGLRAWRPTTRVPPPLPG